MQEQVVPFDLVRMFFGEDPALFYLEIAFRICLIYLYSLMLIRWVGGRGIAQMSTVEFLLVIALGSAVGDAMFYPEVPILHAMLVITGVVLINKALDLLIFRFRPLERVIDGITREVVRDGVICISTLRDQRIGHSELFESIREAGFTNLGQLRSAYLETSGRFSFFASSQPTYGLSIEPPWTIEPPLRLGPRAAIDSAARSACCTCGTVLPEGTPMTPDACRTCGEASWMAAALPPPPVGRKASRQSR